MKPQNPQKQSRVGSYLFIALILIAGLLYFNQHAVYDYARLYNYSPPAEIAALADDIKLTDKGRRLYYANHPSLEGQETFNNHCTDSEKTIVLGCYITRQGIYLYDVQDPRLSGVEQVTAAHEMLHAAYDRLSHRERGRVDAMVAADFAKVTDERIKGNVEEYRRKDPSVVPNELHSILATEVRNLSPDLEKYYQQYFMDRAAVVSFSERYESEFTSREKQRQEYDEQLAVLKQQIDGLSAGLDSTEQQLSRSYQELNRLKQSGQIEAYNAGVPGYNAQVNAYNRDVSRVQGLIAQYNETVEKRNALVSEESELLDAIDSRPKTIEEQ